MVANPPSSTLMSGMHTPPCKPAGRRALRRSLPRGLPRSLPRGVPQNQDEAETLRAWIREAAQRIGFDAVGFARAGDVPDGREALAAFTRNGRHGDMGWMAERQAFRAAPNGLWPEARTLISLGMNYGAVAGGREGRGRPADPLADLSRKGHGVIARYARGRDYHDLVKGRLKRLAQQIHHRSGAEVKVFVDTAPVMEKPVAQTAGIGWQGKHTNLVSREHGSWLLLGEIFTTLALPPDAPESDHCGQCTACLDICPTGALPRPGEMIARRCISYLTIEHKGTIDPALRPLIGNRIYGCDDCLAVCPWNKYAHSAREIQLLPRIELTAPRLADLARLDDAGFRQIFSGSPIKRTGRDRFLRNVLIAIGNSGKPDLVPEAERCLGDPSPLVRGMAVWALSRLLPADAFHALAERHRDHETDFGVQGEWALGTAQGQDSESCGHE